VSTFAICSNEYTTVLLIWITVIKYERTEIDAMIKFVHLFKEVEKINFKILKRIK